MKKILLTIALVAFAFAANAQFVVGGQIGYTTDGNNTHNENIAGPTSTITHIPGDQFLNQNSSSLTILPKIGYNLNDKMQVGVAFGLTWNKIVDYSGYVAQYAAIEDFEGWQRTTNTEVKFIPYFRYNITQFGGFTLFCEAQLGLTLGMNPKIRDYHSAYSLGGIDVPEADVDLREGRKDTYTNFDLTVVPGLNYKFNEKISADLYIDLLGLGYGHHVEKTFRDWNVIGGLPAGSPANTDESTYVSNEFYLTANANAQLLRAHLGLFRLGFNYHF